METGKTPCVVCAWRQTCNKKFSMDGTTTLRCLDFTRDLTLPKPEDEPPGAADERVDKRG
jgi:hypothetical protein